MQQENNINGHDKKLADYAMACELVGRIASYESEDGVIDNIIELLRTLCAPTNIIYISMVDGQPSEIRTFPEAKNSEEVISDLINNFKDDYAWTASGAGFRLKIKGRDGVFGLIEIDGVLFPDYKNHYLNLSLTIASALGLAISNARIYQSLLNANIQLKLEIEKREITANALKISEEKYRTLLDDAAEAIIISDLSGNFLDLNKKAEELTGFVKSEALSLNYTQIHPEEELKRTKAAFDNIINNGFGTLTNAKVKRKDGTMIPVDITGRVIEYGGKKVAQGIFKDIRERLQTELVLRESHDRLLKILENMEAIVYVADMQTYKMIFANRYLKEAIGNVDILDRLCWNTIQSGQGGPCSFCTNNKLLDEKGNVTGVYTWEFQNTVNKKWYYMQDRAIRWIDGRIVRLEIATDITERKILEEKLALEHSFRKAIEESVMAGIAATDLDGRQIYINPSFCKMLGYDESQLIGLHPPHPYWAPEDYAHIRDAFRCTLEGKAPKEGFDLIFMKKTGERLYVNVLMSPLVSKQGEKTGWLASVYDITERKMLEDELKTKTYILSQLNKKLELVVDDKINEIRQKEQMLIQQSKMAAMGEMIGAIAHQWKQPLNAMSLNIQDIQDAYEFGELNKEYIDKMIETSTEQVAFMAKTIDDFRNFFKPSKDKTIFNVVNSIKEILSMFKEMFKKNSISIDFLYNKDNELKCNGYPNEFKQVILNLINNSKDAIVAKRSRNTRTYLEGKIQITVQSEDHAVAITISDNGGGIPEAVIEKIFEPYFTTKPSEIGTGIGLYMSKTIIETNMDGRLTVRNIEGGAEFMITMNRVML
ncbi:MAG: PAS domain S-box protein [Nitrospirae bacterium YQR-1]